MLLVNSLLSWLLLTDWAVKKLQGILLDYVTLDCAGKQCFGFAAVHRVGFALGLFHIILAALLIGVSSSKQRKSFSEVLNAIRVSMLIVSQLVPPFRMAIGVQRL